VGDGYNNSSDPEGNSFGAGTGRYMGDGGLATAASLSNPAGLAFNAAGDLYICDYDNSVVRKVDHSTNIISTVAGVNGTLTSSGDGGQATAAGIGAPIGITFDAAGNYYIADADNNVVRKVTTSGIISTVAGGGSSTADGAAATAEMLDLPYALIVDASGNLYISEAGHTSNRIRKVNTSGTISTFAGNGTFGAPTSGVVATSTTIPAPRGMTRDASGNIYVSAICYVFKINTSNIITYVAGTSTCGYSGDFGSATAAEVNWPDNIALNTSGDLFVIDDGNFRVREITGLGTSTGSGVASTPVAGNGIEVSPNPAGDAFSLRVAAATEQQVQVTITNVTGQVIKELQVAANSPATITLGAPAGFYLVTAATTEGRYVARLVIQ
jgi:trimeric autotransporter adhesin